MNSRKNSYLQYDNLNWQQQEKTKLNASLHEFILKNIISKHPGNEISVFDMGFGIGGFLEMLNESLPVTFKRILLEGCEPSVRNYEYFKSRYAKTNLADIRTFNKTLLDTDTSATFHFVTAVYVFTHVLSDELEAVAKKIKSMLEPRGQFIMVIANENYLKENMDVMTFRLIAKTNLEWGGKKYWQLLHYTDIPEIGTIIDHSREEQLYLDLFKKYGFNLSYRHDLSDHGYLCTILTFRNEG